MHTNQIVSVVICGNFKTTFDYLVKPDIKVMCGNRVLVSFGKKELIGFITAIKQHSDIAPHKLKYIIEVLAQQVLTEPLTQLLQFVCEYYFTPIGLAYKMALPKYLRETVALTPVALKPKTKVIPNNPLTLNELQLKVINSINQRSGFRVEAIQGVTGSGKTEVYLGLIELILSKKQQALILIPEINLSPQTYNRFVNRFPNHHIKLIHSKISAKEKYNTWYHAMNGDLDIIIGTRSACFIPLKNPGIFIIDEEHDQSFKQQTNPKYSAKDLTIKRAQLENIPIVLASATLSSSTWHNITQKKYFYHEMLQRTNNALMPHISIIDTKTQNLFAGISLLALQTIQETLDKGEQVMIFLNRRGFAPLLYCCNCGWKKTCKYCAQNMNVHLQHNMVLCHHCNYKEKLVNICPKCNYNDIQPIGLGTERVELALQEKFASYNILRVDRDTSSSIVKLQNNLDLIHSTTANIIIATQMLAKGHHFANLSLLIVLNADQSLYTADFRALEHLAQLLIQVSGRVGRERVAGKVLIQTAWPEHVIFKDLQNSNYNNIINHILTERAAFKLPPYTYQALLIAYNKQPTKIYTWFDAIINALQPYKDMIAILGPMPALVEKRKNLHTIYLTLQADNRKKLHSILRQVLILPNIVQLQKNLKWELDIDPTMAI